MSTPVVLRRGMPVLVLLLVASVFSGCDDGGELAPSPTPTVDVGTPEPLDDTSMPTAPASPDATQGAGEARRTGDPALDAIIEAVEERDIATLSGLLEYQEIGCTEASGMGGPPKCEEGQEAGDISRVFPFVACHASWTETPAQLLGQFVNAVRGTYAVLETSTGFTLRGEWPAADTLIVFHYGDQQPQEVQGAGARLHIANGRVVAWFGGCGDPPEAFLTVPTGEIVEVIAGPWEEPRPAPEVEAPTTGIPEVDAVIESVATYDWPALRENALETMQSGPLVPCGGHGGPGHVACDPKDGEPGDEVHAFPMARCEGSLARDPGDPLSAFLNAVPRLHSVVEAPAEPSGSELYPHGAYWLIYEFTSEEPAEDGTSYGVVSREGARLQLTEEGGIAVLWYGCNPTVGAIASYAGGPLPVIATSTTTRSESERRRTGDEALDAIVDATEAGDVDALVAAVAIPFKAVGCHMIEEDPRVALEQFTGFGQQLYGVYLPPPESTWWIVFTDHDGRASKLEVAGTPPQVRSLIYPCGFQVDTLIRGRDGQPLPELELSPPR